MKNNWTILALIVFAGLVFTVYGFPWLHTMGRVWVAYVVYGLLVIAFLYSRHNTRPALRRRSRRP